MLISTAFAAASEAAQHDVGFFENPATWVAVAFFVVIGFAARPVMRAMTTGLDARADKIKARIDESEKLREEAKEMLALYQRKQRDSMKEAEDIIAHAKVEAERMAAQAAEDLEASVKRREKQALDRIAQAEASALKEVRDRAIDIAVTATRKVVSESMTPDQATKMVNHSIGELGKKLH